MSEHSSEVGSRGERGRDRGVRIFGWVMALVLLGIWPVVSHLRWHRPGMALHGLPAFFLGLSAWILGWGALGCLRGLAEDGLRGVVSGAALRRVLAAGALLVSGVLLFYAVEAWRGKRAWTRVAEEARVRGVSLDSGQSGVPAVPEAEDFGQWPLFAPLWQSDFLRRMEGPDPVEEGELGALRRVGNRVFAPQWRNQPGWMRGQTQALAGWAAALRAPAASVAYRVRKVDGEVRGRMERLPGTEGPAEAAASLRELLGEFESILDGVQGAARRRGCRLPFDHGSAMLSGDPSERILMGLQVLAGLRAEVAMVEGRSDEACQDLELGLRLAGHARTLPGLYTQPARSQALAHGLQPLWEGLRRRCWSAEQIAGIQRLLEAHRPIEDLEPHRRAVALAVADFVEGVVPTGRAEPAGWAGLSAEDQRMLAWVRRFYPGGWSALSQAATVGAWLHWGTWTDAPSARVAVLRGTSDPCFPVFIVPKLEQMWEDGRQGTTRAEALTRMAETACALERHRLEQGGVPESIGGLVPRYLARVPVDPVDRAPLRYRREGDGRYLVYSVGPDGRDDLGERIIQQGPEEGPRGADAGGDWVWAGGR